MDRSDSFRSLRSDHEALGRSPSDLSRKRSMVRPERQRLSRDDPNYYYSLVTEESNVNVRPSSTGNDPFLAASNSGSGLADELAEEEPMFEGSTDLPRSPSNASRHSWNKFSLGRSNSSPKRRSLGMTKHRSMPSIESTNQPEFFGTTQADYEQEPQAADTGFDEIPIEEMHDDQGSIVSWQDEKGEHRRQPIMPKESNFNPWRTYCLFLTCLIPGQVLSLFGLKTPERQMAWREKIGLISFILLCGAFVGYLTFGFTETVCQNNGTRITMDDVQSNELIISGSVYELGSFSHPGVEGIDDDSPILYPPMDAGGKDASFMFQNVNGNCKGLITPRDNTSIPKTDDGEMGWYFPCQLVNMNNNTLVANEDLANKDTDFYNGWACHSHDSSRSDLYGREVTASIYFTWEDLSNTTKQLVTYNGDVLNLEYLDHLLTDDLEYPEFFMRLRDDESYKGRDISQEMAYGRKRREMNCLREIAKVGVIDTRPIGCIASSVVLYVSLVFIMGLVVVKFLVACYFRFFMARYQGASPMSETEFHNRERRIENWGDDIYSSAVPHYERARYQDYSDPNAPNTPVTMSSHFQRSPRPDVGAQFAADSSLTQPAQSNKRKSAFLDKITAPHSESNRISGVTMSTQNPELTASKVLSGQSLHHEPFYRQSLYGRPNASFDRYGSQLDLSYQGHDPEEIRLDDLAPPTISEQVRSESPVSIISSEGNQNVVPTGPIGGGSEYLVPQPPLGYQPFGYPLAHVMCMVTAYSESVEGLRTTLDSICTTDYPNSHKLVTIVCDGLVKGSGNDMNTPEICLSLMKDFSEPIEDVKPYSYVSVVAGEKRHNMAKVYAGFYDYDDSTVPVEKQQRVPIICIAKCGTPKEANAAKPGNRGKRDSQVILMNFLQHVMFDERMTELDFEIFNGIRSVTGIAPDYYEMMLMVDADTKVFPDCLTHMCAEMVRDPEIMGLCGETKIANKRQSWVTMIQVFEYFISHHQAKGFESVFGWVSCLPGCFSMYRIKSPKGADGYWVPILCNPDIVERYSDNNIDTLHRKNLLLLGEDRFLSTLMAKTFPKRKTVFVPKAACKTIVPDEFKVLLSQRRRWINSTIHNLFELVLVRDTCGVFVISMQFVVFVDLVSTLVLPAALAFTLYVVIIACVRKPTPVLSLVLLAMILGLPGVLIVVTATRASYLLWMFVYLCALPVWNFILPMYAYWKFDDFSWGDTRAIAGGDKGHEEADGEFDSSQIVMKKWTDFQNDRARNLITQSSSQNLLSVP